MWMVFDKYDLIVSRIRLSQSNKGAPRVRDRTPIIALNMGDRNLCMSFLMADNIRSIQSVRRFFPNF